MALGGRGGVEDRVGAPGSGRERGWSELALQKGAVRRGRSRGSRGLALRWSAVLACGVALVACGSPSEPDPRFDLADEWEGTFRTNTAAQVLRLDLSPSTGADLRGTATNNLSSEYDVSGVYEPPTVYLRFTGELETLEFVGEMLAFNIISGSMLSTTEDASDAGRLTLARR